MIRNFLMVAWRSLLRQKGYTFLNIFGLTLGISAALFILLFVNQELSYDRHHERADRLYRIVSHIAEPDDAFNWAVSQIPLGPTLLSEYPEVEAFTRLVPNGEFVFELEDQTFLEENVFFADSAILQIFSFEVLYGDPATSLRQPNEIVLNATLAEKFFGNENPIGKVLKTPDGGSLEVVMVYQDWPQASHFIPHGLISMTDGISQQESWGSFGIYTYVMLQSGSDGNAFAAKLPEVIEKYVAVIFDQFDITVEYVLRPIQTIHLLSEEEGELEPTGDLYFVYTFLAIGVFLLLIACINYMNLATARSAKRAREVGIRKVMGSLRAHLIGQFLTESLLLTLLSILLSIGLVLLLMPLVNLLLVKPLDNSMLFQPLVLGGLGAILLLVGVLSGSYPAFFLSSFQPIKVLKATNLAGKGSGSLLRKSLVVLQFAISLAMLFCTGVVIDQLNFLQNKDMGFTSDPLLRFRLTEPDMREKWPALRNELLQYSGIKTAGTAGSSPGGGYSKELMRVEMEDGAYEEKGMDNFAFDHDFTETMDLRITKGRGFSKDRGTDSTTAVLVNEAMVRRMNWTDPVGKKIELGVGDSIPVAQVIGVVGDYHQQSLYEVISPLLFLYNDNNRIAHVRVNPEQVEGSIAHAQASWEQMFPGVPFEYDFVNEAFQEQYEADQLRSKVFIIFSILTVLIACLGLLGLAAFTAEQRTKELGIRKVLGASVQQLMVLMTREYMILVAIAIPLALAPAIWYLNKWLDTFAYSTSLKPLLFVMGILATLLITILTVSYHSWKAAQNDPVKALKYE
ncbi:MAG: ABC transporter permease [Bacteroidota bacterium]